MKNILLQLAANTPKPNTFNEGGDLQGNIKSVINVVIGILGLVCVIVMIIGGINYMTSAGDAAKVKKGKDTILYGLIGLVICVLAYALVNWVIGNVLAGV
ncbi:hypothetical protein IKW73_03225 [Candidatus Saccharibacteria bacterium]|nr:hypothetical protein [Candidatus Saccharibacteria bacterium]